MSRTKRSLPTAEKAEKIMKDGKVRGHKLTPGQKRLFGGLAHGWKPKGKKGHSNGRGGSRVVSV